MQAACRITATTPQAAGISPLQLHPDVYSLNPEIGWLEPNHRPGRIYGWDVKPWWDKVRHPRHVNHPVDFVPRPHHVVPVKKAISKECANRRSQLITNI